MSDLYSELNEIGYQLGSFTSKETLENVLRLHSFVLTDYNLNVGKLSDVELRKTLMKHGLLVGPVTNQTRPIYQRRLLEILTKETAEGEESDNEEYPINDENTFYPNLSDRKPFSYGLPRTYDEPMTIRNDYKASTSTRNTYRDQNFNEARPRISTKFNEQQTKNRDSTPTKINDKLQVATKSGSSFLYAGITITVALIVFILYFLF